MPSRVAKYGNEFNFFAVSGGRIDNPPHENQVYEIWRKRINPSNTFAYFVARDGIPRG